MLEHLKFVIVGHVDHGKSTLIGRLFYDTDSLPEEKIEEVRKVCEQLGRDLEFGFVMDHLEEERSQGITIDTAQTFFKTGKRRYVIIDAPGHKEFVRNMVTGASQAEAAILIVDAQEGVREQTRRHAYILGMLGLTQVIVVINKMDLVGHAQARFEEVRQDVLGFLSSLGITPTYVIPISASNGDNVAIPSEHMPWYEGLTVLDALDTFEPREPAIAQPLRFPVQDVYKVKDKRILVGRIEAGKIRTGDELVFLPHESASRVRSVEMLWQDRSEAEAGESIGITLEDPLFVERGAVACPPDQRPVITSSLRANVFWMSKRPFVAGEQLLFRLATQEVPVEIEIEKKIDSSTLQTISDHPDQVRETEVAQMRIALRDPVVVENFNDIQELGRFVLVRDLDVVAGGIITHAVS
ncbi:MAG: 50S ribosome-binding GTPase [Acidobacteria bacterium]|nr:50S ribosome-binding GTPase [Acidobacteriota bacterium]